MIFLKTKRNLTLPSIFEKIGMFMLQEADTTIVSESNSYSILEPLISREQRVGNQAPIIIADIWNRFLGNKISGFASRNVDIFRTLLPQTDMQIIEGAARGKEYSVGNWLAALSVTSKAVMMGHVDKYKCKLFVYFVEDWLGTPGYYCIKTERILHNKLSILLLGGYDSTEQRPQGSITGFSKSV